MPSDYPDDIEQYNDHPDSPFYRGGPKEELGETQKLMRARRARRKAPDLYDLWLEIQELPD